MTTHTVLFRNANLLDPLRGELLEGHDLLVEQGVVREVSDKPLHSEVARVIDLKGKTLMPGLIDLHVHVIAVELNLARLVHMPNVLITLRSVPMLRGMLRRGFTTVRDAGGFASGSNDAADAVADPPNSAPSRIRRGGRGRPWFPARRSGAGRRRKPFRRPAPA